MIRPTLPFLQRFLALAEMSMDVNGIVSFCDFVRSGIWEHVFINLSVHEQWLQVHF